MAATEMLSSEYVRLQVTAFFVSKAIGLRSERVDRTPEGVTDKDIEAYGRVLRDTAVEGFYIHARQILDFFYPPATSREDDVLVTDFDPNAELWTKSFPNWSAILNDVRTAAGKLIAHLTYRRVSQQAGVENVPVIHLVRALVGNFNARVNALLWIQGYEQFPFSGFWVALRRKHAHDDDRLDAVVNVVRLAAEDIQDFRSVFGPRVTEIADDCDRAVKALLLSNPPDLGAFERSLVEAIHKLDKLASQAEPYTRSICREAAQHLRECVNHLKAEPPAEQTIPTPTE